MKRGALAVRRRYPGRLLQDVPRWPCLFRGVAPCRPGHAECLVCTGAGVVTVGQVRLGEEVQGICPGTWLLGHPGRVDQRGPSSGSADGLDHCAAPLTWGVAVWVLVAVIRMGVSGTLLATAFGLAAFSVAALYTTERGSEIRRWFRKLSEKRP